MVKVTRYRVNGITLTVLTRSPQHAEHPPVVLVPGTGSAATDWDVVSKELAVDRTVHAVSLRGHGESSWPGRYSIDSMADDLRELLPLLGTEVDLVGHSLGGLVACRALAGGASTVRRLVLEDVGVPHPRPATQLERPEGELEFDWRLVEQVRPEIDVPAPHWRTTLADIAIPTLAISGGPQSFLSPGHVAELVSVVQNGTLATIDVGHLIHLVAPAEFVWTVRSFLDE